MLKYFCELIYSCRQEESNVRFNLVWSRFLALSKLYLSTFMLVDLLCSGLIGGLPILVRT